MPDKSDKPRFSGDVRIAELERKLAEERMKGQLDRDEAIAAARLTHPEIKSKRRTANVLLIVAAIVALGVVLYFMLRPPPPEERRADDDAWSLPPPEDLPPAPELPDLEKLKQKQRPRPTGHVGTKRTAEPDLLGDIGEDERDPTGGLEKSGR